MTAHSSNVYDLPSVDTQLFTRSMHTGGNSTHSYSAALSIGPSIVGVSNSVYFLSMVGSI